MKDNINSAIEAARCVQLNIQLYNQSFAPEHHLIKLSVITASLFCFFCGFKLINTSPEDAIPLLFCATEVTVIFILLFDKAFGIPDMMGELKETILMISIHRKDKRGHGLITKQVKAIRNTGIKVGCFHTFERTTTPKFLHFVITSLGTLLIGF
ncbi:unnamed protein product [Allacma fusca]|uniref:Uncharacterized protein n=1 Tax=Allacma fusca TaxID=39272 RepID=A0A8J2JZ01_9HEXA|nr:unnamed protein product [Allacma fusca]